MTPEEAKHLRLHLSLSIDNMAYMTQISRSTVIRWEKPGGKPPGWLLGWLWCYHHAGADVALMRMLIPKDMPITPRSHPEFYNSIRLGRRVTHIKNELHPNYGKD
jgi:hypothetical protein